MHGKSDISKNSTCNTDNSLTDAIPTILIQQAYYQAYDLTLNHNLRSIQAKNVRTLTSDHVIIAYLRNTTCSKQTKRQGAEIVQLIKVKRLL